MSKLDEQIDKWQVVNPHNGDVFFLDDDQADWLKSLIAQAEKEARIDENERIIKEVDFADITEQLKDFNRLAKRQPNGYCMICGHSPMKLKQWFQDRLAQLRKEQDNE